MAQARIETDRNPIHGADPADLLAQIDREDLAWVIKVLCGALATLVVMLAAAHADHARRVAAPTPTNLASPAPLAAGPAAKASPIVGSPAIEARDIPKSESSLDYARVHTDARN